MSKVEQLRAMREANHAKRQASTVQKVARARAALSSVTNVTNVTNRQNPKAASDKERVIRWRDVNPEQYRKTQRELMRKRRAAKKEQH